MPESRLIPPDDVTRAVDELMFAKLEQPEAHTDEWSVSDISPSGRALEVAEEIERLRAGG